jgi:hypothetical protein
MTSTWVRGGALLLSLLVAACGAGKDAGPEELIDDPDGGVRDDAGNLVDGGGAGFDVKENNPEAGGDTACASTSAAAIKPPVDIIIAIDQSGSMSDDIANVKANINKLSDYLKATGLDYRVVMIARVGSTSSTDVCVPPPLGGPVADCSNTSKPLRNSLPPVFRTSNNSIGSTNALSVILSTYDNPTVGIGWKDAVRADSFKALVPITDDNSALAAATFDTQLLAKVPAVFGTATARKYGAYPIMGASKYPSETKCGSTMVNNGPTYIQLVKMVGGQWFPLCATDFGPLFLDIAKSIANRVACELTIPPPPAGEKLDPNKVNVTYTNPAGMTTTILRDDSKPCAMGANGWQYNADKTKILLCGDACTKAQTDVGGKVNVAFGCGTQFK